MRVVSDTSPLNYLVLIGSVDILPALFAVVEIPASVERELTHAETPDVVRDWLASAPPWLVRRPVPVGVVSGLTHLDEGERDAILLARQLDADLVLMDERSGAAAARESGFAVTGTLGLLDRAARRGMLDIALAVDRLRATSFRCRPTFLREVLRQHRPT